MRKNVIFAYKIQTKKDFEWESYHKKQQDCVSILEQTRCGMPVRSCLNTRIIKLSAKKKKQPEKEHHCFQCPKINLHYISFKKVSYQLAIEPAFMKQKPSEKWQCILALLNLFTEMEIFVCFILLENIYNNQLGYYG